jgi:hypothetical protein
MSMCVLMWECGALDNEVFGCCKFYCSEHHCHSSSFGISSRRFPGR